MIWCKAKASPRRTDLRMAFQAPPVADVQQGVQQAAIADVDLGRFHLALAQVRMPGREHLDHERRCQQVQMMTHGLVRYTEGAGET